MNRRGLLKALKVPALIAVVPVGALTVAACERRKDQFKVDLPEYGQENWAPLIEKAFRDMEAEINRLRNAT